MISHGGQTTYFFSFLWEIQSFRYWTESFSKNTYTDIVPSFLTYHSYSNKYKLFETVFLCIFVLKNESKSGLNALWSHAYLKIALNRKEKVQKDH